MNKRLLAQLEKGSPNWTTGDVSGRLTGWEMNPGLASDPRVSKFAHDYVSSLNNKTVPDRVEFIVKQLEDAGFRQYSTVTKEPVESAFDDNSPKVKKGTKFYFVTEKNLVTAVELGKVPLEKGSMILMGAHIDSVNIISSHVPLKQDYNMAFMPVFPRGGLEIPDWYGHALEFHYHGLISGQSKKPKFGKVVIGAKDHEPKFSFVQESAHFGDDIKPKISDMLVAVGSKPLINARLSRETSIVNAVYAQLFKYGLTKEDLEEGEIVFVPAQKPHFGDFDESFIVGYGQDNWADAYCVLKGLTDSKPAPHTKVAVFYDKEENGDEGPGGLRTRILENYVLPVIANLNNLSVRQQWTYPQSSLSLFCDASEAINAHNPSAHDRSESPYLGSGIVLSKLGGDRKDYDGYAAHAETIRGFRTFLKSNNIPSQIAFMGNRDNRATSASTSFHPDFFRGLDIGVPLSGMHKPAEKVSVIDIYSMYNALNSLNSSKNMNQYFPRIK